MKLIRSAVRDMLAGAGRFGRFKAAARRLATG